MFSQTAYFFEICRRQIMAQAQLLDPGLHMSPRWECGGGGMPRTGAGVGHVTYFRWDGDMGHTCAGVRHVISQVSEYWDEGV